METEEISIRTKAFLLKLSTRKYANEAHTCNNKRMKFYRQRRIQFREDPFDMMQVKKNFINFVARTEFN